MKVQFKININFYTNLKKINKKVVVKYPSLFFQPSDKKMIIDVFHFKETINYLFSLMISKMKVSE